MIQLYCNKQYFFTTLSILKYLTATDDYYTDLLETLTSRVQINQARLNTFHALYCSTFDQDMARVFQFIGMPNIDFTETFKIVKYLSYTFQRRAAV